MSWILAGYLSRLVHEAFAHAPDDATFVLEATTPKSRDQYAHLGFQVRTLTELVSCTHLKTCYSLRALFLLERVMRT